MKVTLYNEKGIPIASYETVIAEPLDEGFQGFVAYESFGVKSVTDREGETIAVKINGETVILKEIPEDIAKKLGLDVELGKNFNAVKRSSTL